MVIIYTIPSIPITWGLAANPSRPTVTFGRRRYGRRWATLHQIWTSLRQPASSLRGLVPLRRYHINSILRVSSFVVLFVLSLKWMKMNLATRAHVGLVVFSAPRRRGAATSSTLYFIAAYTRICSIHHKCENCRSAAPFDGPWPTETEYTITPVLILPPPRPKLRGLPLFLAQAPSPAAHALGHTTSKIFHGSVA